MNDPQACPLGLCPPLGRRQTSLNNATGLVKLDVPAQGGCGSETSLSSQVDVSALPWLVRAWQL